MKGLKFAMIFLTNLELRGYDNLKFLKHQFYIYTCCVLGYGDEINRCHFIFFVKPIIRTDLPGLFNENKGKLRLASLLYCDILTLLYQASSLLNCS